MAQSGLHPSTSDPHSDRDLPFVRITEQPASKLLRFRYDCECKGKSAGSLQGVSSRPKNKTLPAIEIVGYRGRARVVVSCVEWKPFKSSNGKLVYRTHPHKLVGEDCTEGVCYLDIPMNTMTLTFPNLGILCVTKKEINKSLEDRETLRIDPFRTGFEHRKNSHEIDLSAIRLCFQVFIENDYPLQPVVSDPIFDKKGLPDLKILKLSDCSSYVDGGRKEMILLCQKVKKTDICVRFFEETGDWEEFVRIRPDQVHQNCAISFTTPRYKTLNVQEPVDVLLQLYQPSDGSTGEPRYFQLWPRVEVPARKRRNVENKSLVSRHPSQRIKLDTSLETWRPENINIPNEEVWNVPVVRNVEANQRSSIETTESPRNQYYLGLDGPQQFGIVNGVSQHQHTSTNVMNTQDIPPIFNEPLLMPGIVHSGRTDITMKTIGGQFSGPEKMQSNRESETMRNNIYATDVQPQGLVQSPPITHSNNLNNPGKSENVQSVPNVTPQASSQLSSCHVEATTRQNLTRHQYRVNYLKSPPYAASSCTTEAYKYQQTYPVMGIGETTAVRPQEQISSDLGDEVNSDELGLQLIAILADNPNPLPEIESLSISL